MLSSWLNKAKKGHIICRNQQSDGPPPLGCAQNYVHERYDYKGSYDIIQHLLEISLTQVCEPVSHSICTRTDVPYQGAQNTTLMKYDPSDICHLDICNATTGWQQIGFSYSSFPLMTHVAL